MKPVILTEDHPAIIAVYPLPFRSLYFLSGAHSQCICGNRMTACGAMIHSANALQSKRFRMVGVVAFRGRRFRGLRSLSPDYRWNRREEHGSQILFRLADLSRRSNRYSLLAHRSDSFREVGVGKLSDTIWKIAFPFMPRERYR